MAGHKRLSPIDPFIQLCCDLTGAETLYALSAKTKGEFTTQTICKWADRGMHDHKKMARFAGSLGIDIQIVSNWIAVELQQAYSETQLTEIAS